MKKKKLALLLACVMALSALPAMNLFAASSAWLTYGVVTTENDWYMYERTATKPTASSATKSVQATELVMRLNDEVTTGGSFRITLVNAEWVNWDRAQEGYYDSVYGSVYQTVAQAGTNNYTYTRHPGINQMGYTMTITDANRKLSTVTNVKPYDVVDSNGDVSSVGALRKDDRLVVPLVTRLKAEAEATVSISGSSVFSSFSNVFASGTEGATVTTMSSTRSARDVFEINSIVISETVIGTLKDGTFRVSVPDEFNFGTKTSSTSIDSTVAVTLSGLGGTTSAVRYGKVGTTTTDDKSTIEVDLAGITATDIPGIIYISGLYLHVIDDDAAYGDIIATIEDVTLTPTGATTPTDTKIKTQDFVIVKRVDYGVTLNTSGDVPTLVSGRFEAKGDSKYNASHQAVKKVIFQETAYASWWANRDTVFVLPEGVSFRKVKVITHDEKATGSVDLKDKIIEATTSSSVREYTGASANFKADGNTMTLSGLGVAENKKAKLEFEMWLSIEPGFEGDIYLTVEGGAIRDGDIPSVLIAKAVNPVTVDTTVTSVKIGYQSIPVADIVITETAAGMLAKDKSVQLYIEDFSGSNDGIVIGSGNSTDGADIEITNGDLKLTVLRSTATDLEKGFTIKTASKTASTIEIKDVWVKTNRNIPVSNFAPYKLIVGGSAIAANYDYDYYVGTSGFTRTKIGYDMFEVKGVSTDYLKVITAATNETNAFTTVVHVPLDEYYMLVDGKKVEIPVPAFIDASSNSTMLPVRAIANALGISNDNVEWDPSNPDAPTVTVIFNSMVVQFTIGSTQMTTNGVTRSMRNSDDSAAVKAQIKDGSSFVPIRAMSNAFGIEINWDAPSRTVVLNGSYAD